MHIVILERDFLLKNHVKHVSTSVLLTINNFYEFLKSIKYTNNGTPIVPG